MDTAGIPSSRLDPEFASLLAPLDLELEADRWPAYGMWRDSTLAYLNPAYGRGMEPPWGLGARALDATGVVRTAVERVHQSALETREPAVLRYACPTAERAREFELRVFPLGLDTPWPRGLLALHSLVVEAPHEAPHEAHEVRYREAGGLIRQCAHCRRTRRADREEWDVVPAYITRTPRGTSHGLCPPCAAHYFAPSAPEP